jgi:AmmeMemoRadiSam system protein A
MSLSEKDKLTLLEIARTTIESYVRTAKIPSFDVASQALLDKRGAFVTIHKNGRLRGCIGVFTSDKSLYETVVEMSVAAAVRDPRFPRVEEEEFGELDVELSALSELTEVSEPSEVTVGRHGLYIVKGDHRGVLLPQVAIEHGFDRDTFLDETCIKAGLPEGSWREGASVYVFEADVFNEGKAGGEGPEGGPEGGA